MTLPSRQPWNPEPILGYNTTDFLNLPLDNNEEDNSPRASNNGKDKSDQRI